MSEIQLYLDLPNQNRICITLAKRVSVDEFATVMDIVRQAAPLAFIDSTIGVQANEKRAEVTK